MRNREFYHDLISELEENGIKYGSQEKAVAELSKKFKKSKSTIYSWLKLAKTTYGLEPNYVTTNEDRLKFENKQLKKKLCKAQDELDNLYKFEKLLMTAEDVRFNAWSINGNHSDSEKRVPAVIFSDWHVGEIVDPAQTGFVNEFNMEIAEKRVHALVDRTIQTCKELNCTNYGIVVPLLGDFVSGAIVDELEVTNEHPILVTMLKTRDWLVSCLTIFADFFGKVFVPCSPGNHGRLSKKVSYKNYSVDNYDWAIYHLVYRHFKEKKDKRVSFMIPESGDCMFKICKTKYYATHGDRLGVRGGDGIIGTIGPIVRGEIKLRHSIPHGSSNYDVLLVGHWHQPMFLPRVIVNNTLKGLDEYSVGALRSYPTTPSQVFWVTTEHGITYRKEILVSDAGVRGEAYVEI